MSPLPGTPDQRRALVDHWRRRERDERVRTEVAATPDAAPRPGTGGEMTDPFDALASRVESQAPRPVFAQGLHARLLVALDLDVATPIDLPRRKPVQPTTTTPVATAVTPYLTASHAAAALEWYAYAFGAVEQYRIVGDDCRIGHAEFRIGSATLYLSDEYPAMGVVAPTSLGGTPTAMHLQVGAVDDLYARAVAADS